MAKVATSSNATKSTSISAPGWYASLATGDTDSDNNYQATKKTYSPTSSTGSTETDNAYKASLTNQGKVNQALEEVRSNGGGTQTPATTTSNYYDVVGEDGNGGVSDVTKAANYGYKVNTSERGGGDSGSTIDDLNSQTSEVGLSPTQKTTLNSLATKAGVTSSSGNGYSTYQELITDLLDKLSDNTTQYKSIINELEGKLYSNDQSYTKAMQELENKLSTQNTTLNDIISGLSTKLNTSENSLANLQTAYDTALEEQKKAIQLGIDQSVNTINNQKNSVSNSYADTLRQLYLDKMNAQKNIGQQMAAAGQTGGQAESTLLGLNTNYADALRQSEQAKASALSELETAIANAQLSGNADIANAIANNATESANAYTNQLNNLINSGINVANLINGIDNSNFNNQMNYANLINNKNNTDFSNGLSLANQINSSDNSNIANSINLASLINSVDSDNQSTAYSRAITWLQNGIIPDSATLASAGITEEEAQNFVNSIGSQTTSSSARSTTKKTQSGNSENGSAESGNNGSTSITYTKAQAKTKIKGAIAKGYITQDEVDAIEAATGSDFNDLLYEYDSSPEEIEIKKAGVIEAPISQLTSQASVKDITGLTDAENYMDVILGAKSLVNQKASDNDIESYFAKAKLDGLITRQQYLSLVQEYCPNIVNG